MLNLQANLFFTILFFVLKLLLPLLFQTIKLFLGDFMMKQKIKENLFFIFYIGVIVFSLTLLVENLFAIKTNFTDFCKGFGVGLELAGIFFIIKRNKLKK